MFLCNITDLEVGQELLRPAVTLGLHDDIGQLVDDGVERPLRHQRLREIDLKSSVSSVVLCFSISLVPWRLQRSEELSACFTAAHVLPAQTFHALKCLSS